MAKKGTRPRSHTSSNDPVQFRPGNILGGAVDELFGTWGVGRNETVRRLAALATFGLDYRHHELVCQYAKSAYGDRDFVEACELIAVQLQAADTERSKAKKSLMTEDERQIEIEHIVRNYLVMHRDPEEPEKRRQHVKVFRTDS